jgi:amino acid permease
MKQYCHAIMITAILHVLLLLQQQQQQQQQQNVLINDILISFAWQYMCIILSFLRLKGCSL